MSDKVKVICIKIGKYTHHQKLEIGKVYLSKDVGKATLSTYNLEDGKFIGYFHKDMFEDWITRNRENILNDLGI